MKIQNCSQSQTAGYRVSRSACRTGLTLAEVMISLMVLAIGLMGVLALYPLGARQMATAVKDERTAQLAAQAEGMMRIYWRNACLTNGALDTSSTIISQSPELQYLDGYPASVTSTPSLGLISESSSGASWPLYLDPIAYLALGDPQKSWIGSASTPVPAQVLPRRSATMAGTSALSMTQRLRLFGLLDDISFNENGLTGPSVNRGHRYNCGWMIQRAKNNVRHEVNLKVVVYQNRSPDSPSAENFAGATSPAVGTDTITVSNGALVRSGSWILLTHTLNGSRLAATEPFADFYRVTDVNGNQLSVSPAVRPHGNGAYTAYAFVLEDVVEVFDRGTITPFEVPAS